MNTQTLKKLTEYHLRREWSYRIDGLRDVLEFCYIEWFNDFLTVERYAEYHSLSVADACRIVDLGRRIHHHNQRHAH